MAPRQIVWHSAGMHQVPDGEGWLDDRLAARLAAMPYTKRREEARLGRWTAKSAVAVVLGLDAADHDVLGDIVVGNAPDGAPEAFWRGNPAGVTIAMTDRADWAICAVAGVAMRIGCDLEVIEARSRAFVRDYFTAAEQAAVGGGEPDLTANLIWSAKESALKVLRTGLRRDTRSVEVHLGRGVTEGWHPLAIKAVEGATYPGWWTRFGEFVLTIAATEPVPPPQSIHQPPALATAVPSHGWMGRPRS